MIRRSGWAEGWFMRTTYELLRKNMFGTQLAWSILVTVFWSKATVKQLRICYWAFHLRFEQRKSNFSLIYLRSRRLSNFSCTQNFESLWISTPLTVSFQHRSRTSAPRISEIPNLEKPIIFKWNHWFNFGRVFFFSDQIHEEICSGLPGWIFQASLEVLNRCAYSADLMTVGGSLNSLFLDQLVEILWGGKEVGRWLEDARRWYGVVWVWISHGMGSWYGCGHMMLSRPWWSVGEVDSPKGQENCTRIWGLNFRSSLVVGEIWKKSPRLKWWIFLDPSCSAATEAWGDIFQQRIHAEQAAFGGSCLLWEVGA